MTSSESLRSGLILRDPPELSLLSREASSAVAFASVPADAPPGPLPKWWYHTITFPDGEVTPGTYDHRELLPHYGLPDDLRGDTVLDAGTADGYWAFEMERRGAEVTAVDVPAWEDLDFPPQAFSLLSTLPPAHRRERFHEARTRLGSDVRYLDRSIYRLDPDDLGRFDLVHAGDILLHLERPLEALRRLRGVTSENGRLILADVVDPSLPGREGQTFLVRYIGGWDSVTWWTPSIDAAAQMIIDAGFSAVTVHAVYMLPVRGETEGPWRAVFHATA